MVACVPSFSEASMMVIGLTQDVPAGYTVKATDESTGTTLIVEAGSLPDVENWSLVRFTDQVRQVRLG